MKDKDWERDMALTAAGDARHDPKHESACMCPRCNERELIRPLVRNALSRKDNKTYICSECGVAEALEDWARARARASSKSKSK